MLKLYNSLNRKIEEFKPINSDLVGFYSCGPTVYDYAHLGNLRTMLLNDLIRRSLIYNGYKVQHIMNITDVGHLTSDSDTGEDKIEKNANTLDDVVTITEKYTESFFDDLKALNIIPAEKYPKASHHVQEHIDLIQKLIDKNFAYESDEAVYFDVAKFPSYNKLTGQNLDDMLLGARQDVVLDPKKKNPIDFVLWFKTVGRYEHHIQRWPSPWGDGFPGWHIECSSISAKYLGQPFDLHSGGVDLKFPHHTNEIAQSEAAESKPLANYWVHGEFLLIEKGKMAKSEGNFLTLQAIIEKRFNPLAFRYLAMTSHYRSKLNFTWESLTAAQNALNNLYLEVSTFDPTGKIIAEYDEKFSQALNNDLEMPQAIAIMWDMIKSKNNSADKLATLLKFDEILGLRIQQIWESAQNIPEIIQSLISEREKARADKNFSRSDEIRQEIESQGYNLEDTIDGYKIKKKF